MSTASTCDRAGPAVSFAGIRRAERAQQRRNRLPAGAPGFGRTQCGQPGGVAQREARARCDDEMTDDRFR